MPAPDRSSTSAHCKRTADRGSVSRPAGSEPLWRAIILPETPQGDSSSPAASDASTVSVTRRTTTTGARLHSSGSDASSPVPPFQLQPATAPSAARGQQDDDYCRDTAQSLAAAAASNADVPVPQGSSPSAHDAEKSAPVGPAAEGRHSPAVTVQPDSAAEPPLTAGAALLPQRTTAVNVATPVAAVAAAIEASAEGEPTAPHPEDLPAAAAATPAAAQAETPAAEAGSAKPSAARSVVGSIMGAAWSAAGLWSGMKPAASCPPPRPAPAPASQPALDAGSAAGADSSAVASAMLQQGAPPASPPQATAAVSSDCESPDVFSTPEGELPPSPGSPMRAPCGLAPLPCGLTTAAMNDAMSADAVCDAAGEAAAAPESRTGVSPPCMSAAPVQMLSISPLPGSQPDAGLLRSRVHEPVRLRYLILNRLVILDLHPTLPAVARRFPHGPAHGPMRSSFAARVPQAMNTLQTGM